LFIFNISATSGELGLEVFSGLLNLVEHGQLKASLKKTKKLKKKKKKININKKKIKHKPD